MPERAVSLDDGAVRLPERPPEDGAYRDSGEAGGKIALGNNANAVLSLDLITDGGAGNRRDDGVTTGAVSGRGTTIAVEVFATGVTTSLAGMIVKFDFDASLLAFVRAENSAFPLSVPAGSVGTNFAATGGNTVTLASSGFLARAEFETVADVAGREFSIGIASVTLAESATSSDEITTAGEIRFNAGKSPDFDGDGTVGFSDFLRFAGAFDSQQGDAAFDARFDLDGDGTVGFFDFLTFASAFGSQVPPTVGGGGGNGSATVTIADANLRAVVADNLGKAPNASITRAEMATLTRLDARNKGIRSLTGLEHATNLTRLELDDNSISDISALSTLTNLTLLYLDNNSISNISALSTLINLTRLSLFDNSVSDISVLSTLINLKWLYLGGNSISDISVLSTLTKLTWLDLDTNSISNISALSTLINLTWLDVHTNSISDISALSTLTKLTRLELHTNSISNISALSTLINLTRLELHTNSISDISALSTLINLTELWLGINSISNISALSNLTNLTWLYLGGNSISNISALYNLTNLTLLSLSGNSISDISPLVANTGLGNGDTVNLRRNPLSNASIDTHIPALQHRRVNVFFDRTFSDLDDENTRPSDITYANNRFYVIDFDDYKVYVYTSSGQRVASADFNLDDLKGITSYGNHITYANNRFYVLRDGYSDDDKVYVYSSSGQRVESADFNLDDDNNEPNGITYANNRFYVVDNVDNRGFIGDEIEKVYVYTSSGQRVESADFDLDGDNDNPSDITYANNRFYVLDYSDDKVYVYSSSGQRQASADFDLDDDNSNPNGSTYANNRFYVLDDYDDKVYVYTIGGQSGNSGGGSATVTIPDTNLRAVIADSLGKAPNASITRTEMATLTHLDAGNMNIRSLTGLEHATSLTVLYLSFNSLSDISALSNLTNLTDLGLQGNSISDISALSNLTNLTWLSLSNNSSSDLSALSNLTNLTTLTLADNSISDLSALSNLTNLTWLDLGHNSLSDISALSNLTNLTELILYGNDISNISPLVENTGLGSGDTIRLHGNPLSSTSINTHIPALQRRGVTVLFDSPDLIVESPSVSGNALTTGQSFTLSATVRNQGTGSSASTTLRYYQSSDSGISTSDTQVGTHGVNGLSASGTSAESISLNAPSSAGTYYYGACVASVSGESDTRNNCSTGVRVTVQAAADDHSNTRSGATSLSLGSSRSGQIETGSDVDYFRVLVTGSGTLTIYTTGSLDTTGELQGSSGSVLASDDNGGSGSNFRIEHSVSSGTYYIKVESHGSETGSYTVHASFTSSGGTPPPSAVTGSITECSFTQNGLIYNIRITGAVQARRSVSSLTLRGYVGSSSVGFASLGSMSAGQTRSFTLTGISSSQPSGSCRVEMEWREGSSKSHGVVVDER